MRSRLLALIVLCAGQLMMILDGNIVVVALPTIQRELGFTASGLAWVANAYLVAFGGLLLLAGRLGDLLGRKRVFLAGLAVFSAASAWCGLADSAGMLVVARFAQGAGGALASAVVLGMVTGLFPQPGEQARAIGVVGFTGAAGASIGTLAGGVLTQLASWHWIFFVNVPIGLLTLLLAARVLADEPGLGWRAGADVPGAVLVTGGLMVGVYTIVTVSDHGWASAPTLGLGALAVALLGVFGWRQARAATPLLAPRVLRSRTVTGANVVQALMVAGFFGFQFLLALYVQRVLGFDPLRTGLGFLPITVVIGGMSLLVSARLIGRFGAVAVVRVALALAVAGFAWLTQAPAHGGYLSVVLPVMVLLGLGAGLALPAVAVLAMSDVDPRDAGLASGLANTTQQVGGAFGLAVTTTLAAGRTAALHNAPGALLAGYHLGFAIAAGFAAAALLASVIITTPQRRADDDPAATGGVRTSRIEA